MASAAVAAAASSGAGSVMPGSISQSQFQQNHQNLINDLMQQNNLTVSAVAAAANNILLNMNLAKLPRLARMLASKLTIVAIRPSCVVNLARMVNANTVTNVSLPMV
jgi:hypothetical protein